MNYNKILEQVKANVPKAMKDVNQWCVWRYKLMRDRKGDPVFDEDGRQKQTKVPIHAETYRLIDATDLSNGVSFESAMEAYRCSCDRGGYARTEGLGFLLGNGFAGVDLDKVVDKQSRAIVKDWAKEGVALLETYTEFSPSGTGVKMIVEAEEEDVLFQCEDIDDLFNKVTFPDKSAIEIYCQDRFFTVTGDRLPGTPDDVEARPKELADLYFRHFAGKHAEDKQRTGKQGEFRQPDSLTLDTEQILEAAFRARNGEKIRTLWEGRSIHHGDDSADDAALVWGLSFYTGPNLDLLEHMMYQSRRVRAKWDSKRKGHGTWLKMTIKNCMQHEEYYDWSKLTDADLIEDKLTKTIRDVASSLPPGEDIDDPDDYRDEPPKEPPRVEAEPCLDEQRVPVNQPKPIEPILLSPSEARRKAASQVNTPFIDGIAGFGKLHILSGLPGSGKSVLVLELIKAISLGDKFLGWLDTTKAHCVLVDPENCLNDSLHLLDKMFGDGERGGFEHAVSWVDQDSCPTPMTAEFIESCIKKVKAKHGPDTLVALFLDTIRGNYGTMEKYDENKPECITAILNPLKGLASKTGTAIFVLHHNNWQNRVSGNTQLRGACDFVLEYHRDVDKLTGKLHRIRGRGVTGVFDPITIEMEPTSGRIRATGTKGEEAKAARVNVDLDHMDILAMLLPQKREEAITATQLISRVNEWNKTQVAFNEEPTVIGQKKVRTLIERMPRFGKADFELRNAHNHYWRS